MVLVSVSASNDNLPMLGKLFHFRETIILVWRGKKKLMFIQIETNVYILKIKRLALCFIEENCN